MTDPVIDISPLGSRWQTRDPFLFCVHHIDNYPKGNEKLGPAASLAGHDVGQDFEGRDGWRMYHGSVVPGFPQHPHRGFETVTIVRDGYIDHSDSLGANTRAELEQAVADYRRTQFGGWPFSADDPVHPRDAGRFARHADGRVEHAP